MGYPIQRNSTTQDLVFFLVQSSDHITGLTGLGSSVTVTIRKPGGTFATPSGAVTEIANGWYKVAANSTDNNTLGPLLLHASGTGSDPCDEQYHVVAYDPLSNSTLGLSGFGAAALAANGLDAVMPESGLNVRQVLALILAAVANACSGLGGVQASFKDPANVATRIQGNTDSFGNRSSVTLSPPP